LKTQRNEILTETGSAHQQYWFKAQSMWLTFPLFLY